MADHDQHKHNRKHPAATHRVPYWKRAHHHWPFWVAMFLMFAAIGIYVITNSLSLVPHGVSGLVTSHEAR